MTVVLARKLLARAMEAAATSDDSARGHADGTAAGEERSERVDCGLIVRDAIGRNDDGRVADVEIHIARRRHFSVDFHAAGRGEIDDLDAAERRGARAGVGIDMRVGVVAARCDR